MAENLNLPNVYRGRQRLVTQHDFDLLKEELINLIVGPTFEDQDSESFTIISDSSINIENKILTDGIVPIINEQNKSFYGDWTSNSIHEYINLNENENNEDYFILNTKENILATTISSYFIVKIFNGNDVLISSFVTSEITENYTFSNMLNEITNISIEISNFKENSSYFLFKPIFKINLKSIFPNGGVFFIKIIHCDGLYRNSFTSKKYLYNIGPLPTYENVNYNVITDNLNSEHVKTFYCSGIKYISNGNINLQIKKIENLYNLVGIKNNIEFNFEKIDKNLSITQFTKLSQNDNVFNWEATLKINENILNINYLTGYVIFNNAFGSSKININIPILLNTLNLKQSDELNEYFSDESFRIVNSFIKDNNSNFIAWNSEQNLLNNTTLQKNDGLMIIPGSGLLYPKGNWDEFIPSGSPNYNNNENNYCYFSRIFSGKPGKKLGGKFIFKGISKNDFLSDNVECLISPVPDLDNNEEFTWYNLKEIREMSCLYNNENENLLILGIRTNIKDIKDGVEISWMYPKNIISNNSICFKLGLKQTSTFIIKSISLINLDDSKEW